MTDREIFKNNLISLMKAANVTQLDIVNNIGVKQQTVSAWVCGRGYPRAESLTKLCQFFGIRMSDLVADHEESNTEEDKILSLFRALSPEGKQKMLERAEEMRLIYPIGRRKNG